MPSRKNDLGARCIAALIFDRSGRSVAAISLSAPSPRIPMSEVPRFGTKVREVGKEISRHLGYVPRPF